MEQGFNHSKMTQNKAENIYFTMVDYSVFVILLVVSLLIGVFYGFISKRKQDSTVEYLMGSKQMGILPIAISMIATHISAVIILGIPSEIYLYGTQYWASFISGILITLAVSYIYLPVFYELQNMTMFTYLEQRFDVKLRKLASVLYSLAATIYLPVMVYAPAIAFNQVTGIGIHVITPIMCSVCIFYTTVGGLRAVVWTDTIQFISMVGGVIVVMVIGTIGAGGLGSVYDIAEKGGRLIWFDMDTSGTTRSSFLSVTIGLTSLWISTIGLSPECIQRFLSVPTLSDAKKVLWIFGIGHSIIKLGALFCGVIVFARYHNCDPIAVGVVDKPDQIFPYYVMDIARNLPGLPGIFIAGVFSAALSSLSSFMNCISGAVFVDFIKPLYPNLSEKTSSNIMKIIVVIVGCLSILLVFIVEKLGNIFQAAVSITGITGGPLLGLYTIGMTMPKANKYGALWGSLISLFVIGFLTVGSQLAVAKEELVYPSLPFSIDECENLGYFKFRNGTSFNLNSTTLIYNENADHSKVYSIFRSNFGHFYSLFGTILVFLIGYPISLLTGGQKDLDPKLLTPIVRSYYERRQLQYISNLSEMKPLKSIKEIKLELYDN